MVTSHEEIRKELIEIIKNVASEVWSEDFNNKSNLNVKVIQQALSRFNSSFLQLTIYEINSMINEENYKFKFHLTKATPEQKNKFDYFIEKTTTAISEKFNIEINTGKFHNLVGEKKLSGIVEYIKKELYKQKEYVERELYKQKEYVEIASKVQKILIDKSYKFWSAEAVIKDCKKDIKSISKKKEIVSIIIINESEGLTKIKKISESQDTQTQEDLLIKISKLESAQEQEQSIKHIFNKNSLQVKLATVIKFPFLEEQANALNLQTSEKYDKFTNEATEALNEKFENLKISPDDLKNMIKDEKTLGDLAEEIYEKKEKGQFKFSSVNFANVPHFLMS